jgi:geranylgeranyl diphosphate synthase type I
MTAAAPLGADFPTLLEHVRPAVEERLVAAWEQRVANAVPYGTEVAAMLRAARDLTLRGGKRFRAALVAAAYHGVDPEAPMGPAFAGGAAIELLQTYLLIQDDWMDGDATRRGGPAVHAALTDLLGTPHLGASSAILASDLTLGLAFSLLTTTELSAARIVRAVRLLAEVNHDVVIGQQLDMMGRAEDVAAMHALKTGSYTARGPLAMGATLAGADGATLEALDRFAKPLGVAFQLRDDLLGTFGTTADTGKPVGNDLRAGKRTAVVAEAATRLDAEGNRALACAFGRGDASSEEVLRATAALEDCGARRAVAESLARLCREAEPLAYALPLSETARRMLAGAALALLPKDTAGNAVGPFRDAAG